MRWLGLLFFSWFCKLRRYFAHRTSEIVLWVYETISCLRLDCKKSTKFLSACPCLWKYEKLRNCIFCYCQIGGIYIQLDFGQFMIFKLSLCTFIALQIYKFFLFTSSHWEIARIDSEWIPNVSASPSLKKHCLISSFNRKRYLMIS